MKIIVCIKQVPDVEVDFLFTPEYPGIEVDKMPMIINPGDEVALEGALKMKSIYPETEVILFSLGPPAARETLEYGLSMGADTAYHIVDSTYTFGKAFRTAHILSRAIQEIGYDIILFGYRAVDDRLHFVGPAVAEFLGLPHITGVTFLKVFKGINKCEAHQEVPSGINIVECPYPAVFTVKRGLFLPRYPSMADRLSAKEKGITTLPISNYWHEQDTARFPDLASTRFSIAETMEKERKVTLTTTREIARILKKYKARTPDTGTVPDKVSGEEL
jgi:electron transfer flavoprotein beta subunit